MAGNRVHEAYETLLRVFGRQNWWPSDGTFETAVGAVLTQGTAWTNARLAVANLRAVGALTPEGLSALSASEIESQIRPAGFQRRKAATLLALSAAAGGTSPGWDALLATDAGEARERLLGLSGIGPETADAILNYAACRPVFVVDEYTRRFATRHGLAEDGATYAELQLIFESSLPDDAELLSECHALIVQLGKTFCKTRPQCDICPLRGDLVKRD